MALIRIALVCCTLLAILHSAEPLKDPQLIRQLTDLGFLKYATPANARAIEASYDELGFPAILSYDTVRVFSADTEELASGGIKRFLQSLKPFFDLQGITITDLKFTSDVRSKSTIWVNDKPYTLHQPEDFVQTDKGRTPKQAVLMVRLFSMINQLLVDAKSKEQIYALNGGEDLHGIFLTPELFALLSRYPNVPRASLPYVPVLEPPNFGQGTDDK